MYTCYVDDKMDFACKIYVLNLQVALLSSTAGGDVAAARGETYFVLDFFIVDGLYWKPAKRT